MKKSEITHLQTKIKTLNSELAKLGDPKPLEELLQIVHKPGFTSVAEGMFIAAIVDSLQQHTAATLQLRTSLLSAASRVELNPQPLPP